MAESRAEWITHAEATAIVGCGLKVIGNRQRAGIIARRYPHDRKIPSLSRASVEAFAEQWKREQAEKARPKPKPMLLGGPPDDGDVWLDAPTASLVVGVSPQYLGRLAIQGRLPAARDKRTLRWWFRRRHIEDYAAERALIRYREGVSA